MSIWQDTTGQPTLGVALCDRCKLAYPLLQLFPDPNSPGLRVCKYDLDELDPYRLAMRPSDNIVLPFVRPDQNLALPPPDTLAAVLLLATQGDDLYQTEDGNYLTIN